MMTIERNFSVCEAGSISQFEPALRSVRLPYWRTGNDRITIVIDTKYAIIIAHTGTVTRWCTNTRANISAITKVNTGMQALMRTVSPAFCQERVRS